MVNNLEALAIGIENGIMNEQFSAKLHKGMINKEFKEFNNKSCLLFAIQHASTEHVSYLLKNYKNEISQDQCHMALQHAVAFYHCDPMLDERENLSKERHANFKKIILQLLKLNLPWKTECFTESFKFIDPKDELLLALNENTFTNKLSLSPTSRYQINLMLANRLLLKRSANTLLPLFVYFSNALSLKREHDIKVSKDEELFFSSLNIQNLILESLPEKAIDVYKHQLKSSHSTLGKQLLLVLKSHDGSDQIQLLEAILEIRLAVQAAIKRFNYSEFFSKNLRRLTNNVPEPNHRTSILRVIKNHLMNFYRIEDGKSHFLPSDVHFFLQKLEYKWNKSEDAYAELIIAAHRNKTPIAGVSAKTTFEATHLLAQHYQRHGTEVQLLQCLSLHIAAYLNLANIQVKPITDKLILSLKQNSSSKLKHLIKSYEKFNDYLTCKNPIKFLQENYLPAIYDHVNHLSDTCGFFSKSNQATKLYFYTKVLLLCQPPENAAHFFGLSLHVIEKMQHQASQYLDQISNNLHSDNNQLARFYEKIIKINKSYAADDFPNQTDSFMLRESMHIDKKLASKVRLTIKHSLQVTEEWLSELDNKNAGYYKNIQALALMKSEVELLIPKMK